MPFRFVSRLLAAIWTKGWYFGIVLSAKKCKQIISVILRQELRTGETDSN
jgi:hypothetical protein